MRRIVVFEELVVVHALGAHKERVAAGWLNARQIIGLSESEVVTPDSVPGGATPTELAAWTAVSRVLLNLDETISKE